MKNLLKYSLIAISILAIGTFLYAQTAVIGIPWELRGVNIFQGTSSTGQIFLRDGSGAAPVISFFSETNAGIYHPIGGALAISFGGAEAHRFGGNFHWISQDSGFITFGGATDLIILRDAPDTFAQKRGNNDQKQRWYGANGAYFQIAAQSELLTILAGPTTDTAMSIPANAIVRGVAVYVVTVIPGPAVTFTVTGTTSGTTFNTAAVGVAAGSNDIGTQNTPYKNGAAQTIRITPNANPGAATGQVRIVLFYEIPSAPTS